MTKEKIVVTGVNGFIGNAVANALKNGGYYVIGIGRKEKTESESDEYYRADISSDSFMDISVKNCFAIIHTAACLEKDLWNQNVFDTNVTGTFNVIKLSLRLGCKKFIYTSSLPIIGKPEVLPISETHSVNPPTFYHATKLMGEELVHLLSKSGMEGISLRIPSPVGRGMPCTTILPIFLKKALEGAAIELSGKGMRKQNYVDVRDINRAVLNILDQNVESGVYNIAAEKAISNYDLAKLCIQKTGSKSEIRFNGTLDETDDFDWTTDCKKAAEAFGYKSEYAIEDTIDAILDGLKQR